ncbi:MAG: PduL/EutD family phosphate acyltransferase [Oscillospiraceae bacterium]
MEKQVLVEISARHVHVTQETLEKLFGKGHQLTVKKMLSQPGQFASMEKVDIVGPKRTLSGVSILGPCRKADQVELSLTDARNIGLTVPIRESGDLEGSAACKIVGPCGEIELKQGVIAAERHVHLTPETAEKWGLKEKQKVSVKIETPARSLTFDDVVIRVSDKFTNAMHVDTDEGNAAGISGTATGVILD